MKITDAKKIYVIGLGGVGVSAVAKYFLARGTKVTGSDPSPSPLIDDVVRQGAIYIGDANPKQLTSDTDLVVYTDACPPEHPELQRAAELRIPTLSFAAALGGIMQEYRQRVAVAGTNGKSTTTALTGLLLGAAGLDPTVFVGSRVGAWQGNLRLGKSELFVAEADEYRNHFQAFHPTIFTITNIELDHTDFFQSLDQVVKSFDTVIRSMDAAGQLILNADEEVLLKHWSSCPGVVTFGQSPGVDLRWIVIDQTAGQQRFQAFWRGQSLGTFVLHVPGQFNLANAAAAMTTALVVGASPQTFDKTLSTFRGIWRRFEILVDGTITVVSDYGHHPTAIAGTIAGARKFYPGRRLVLVFQPHHHHRLTALFDQFVLALSGADVAIISEVYAVLGREHTERMKTSQDVVEAIRRDGRKNVFYAPTPATAEVLAGRHIQVGDVVVIMGAGDIWTIAEPLAKRYEH